MATSDLDFLLVEYEQKKEMQNLIHKKEKKKYTKKFRDLSK